MRSRLFIALLKPLVPEFILAAVILCGANTGNSNSPALNTKNHISVYTNSSKGLATYTTEQVMNNPLLGAGGIEGVAIEGVARKE